MPFRRRFLSSFDAVVRVAAWAGALLAAAASVFHLRAFFDPEGAGHGALRRNLLIGAVVCMTAALGARAAVLGTVPLSSPLESLYAYGWLVALVFLLLVRGSARTPVGALLVPFGALCTFVGMAGLSSAREVQPILRHPLFALHAVTSFLGYSALSVAFCAGVIYLLLFDEISHKRVGPMFARLPSLEDLDRLGHRTVILGFALLTAGIVIGMVWAQARVERGLGLGAQERVDAAHLGPLPRLSRGAKRRPAGTASAPRGFRRSGSRSRSSRSSAPITLLGWGRHVF